MKRWLEAVGTYQVELISADVEKVLREILKENISVRNVKKLSELACRFQADGRDVDRIGSIAKRNGASLRTQTSGGFYWSVRRLLRRRLLLAGLALFLVMTYWIQGRVLFVQVSGNQSVPARQILEAAERYGVRFGAERKEIRSETMKNGLLSEIPKLQWAGVNTAGCVASIQVRERADEAAEDGRHRVSSIVASTDGYILSGTVTNGTALFHPGQTVQKGQTLISGYTDTGLLIQACRAAGEIFGQTDRKLSMKIPVSHILRGEVEEVRHSVSILLQKKRINLWKDSGISCESCGRMYKEYYMTLPGGFRTPFALCIDTYIYYPECAAEMEKSDAQLLMADFGRRYLNDQMIAGTIRKESVTTFRSQNSFVMYGHYECEEMIGRERFEQIGETNG